MADVSVSLDREDADAARDEDRAQIILITGLTLAVLFVAVVLLLNTVIYTENLATRGVDAGGAEAIEFREGAVDDLAGLLHREHRNSTDDVFANFNASARRYGRTVADLRARDGAVGEVRVDNSTVVTGYFIAQNETDSGFRDMTAPDGTTTNWTVAGNATRTRNYRLTVDPGSLSSSAGSIPSSASRSVSVRESYSRLSVSTASSTGTARNCWGLECWTSMSPFVSSTRVASYTRVRGTSEISLISLAVARGTRESATNVFASYSLRPSCWSNSTAAS